MPPPQAGKERKLWIFPVVVTVIAVVAAIAIAGTIIFIFSDGGQTGSAVIVSVTHTPQNPSPGQTIMITVESKNASDCGVQTLSFFKGGSDDRGFGPSCGSAHWDVNIGSFEDGTIVWYVVSVRGSDGNLVISQNNTIQIGAVESSNITTLKISAVSHYPQTPIVSGGMVNVEAGVSSNATIENVEIRHVIFGNHSGGTGVGSMSTSGGNIYKAHIPFGFFEDVPDFEGITIYYRIAAKDSSGNTALSEVISFTVS
jgi:hypothetical protein